MCVSSGATKWLKVPRSLRNEVGKTRIHQCCSTFHGESSHSGCTASINFGFLITEHIKFAPDLTFRLINHHYRKKTCVNSLGDLFIQDEFGPVQLQ
ncbi:hypothetical protein ElyMa_004949600 [Elysia marginata]|uniref:Uncharacterized protein n=1 Tax=Elysia marginata TaxID=1093978 RepID=A0AAV4J000_9GAST|nr:hypothetical protein ElyMa_004949600 [Elysia marginata]